MVIFKQSVCWRRTKLLYTEMPFCMYLLKIEIASNQYDYSEIYFVLVLLAIPGNLSSAVSNCAVKTIKTVQSHLGDE